MANLWIAINDIDEIVSWQTIPRKADGSIDEDSVMPEHMIEADETLFGEYDPIRMFWNEGSPVLNDKFAILEFNTERSRLMAKYEWRMTKKLEEGSSALDAYLATEEAQKIIEYKQRLRDIPQADSGYPHNVTWPPRPDI